MGGVPSGSGLRFTIGGRKASLTVSGGGRGAPCTRVEVDVWGASPGSLHILREGFGESLLKKFGVQDLESGDPAFDAAYIIRAMPESLVGRLFSPERRGKVIASVRRIGSLSDAEIELDAYTLSVQARTSSPDAGDLLRLVETAQDFSAYLIQPRAVLGIEAGEVRVRLEGKCPVCGSALGAEVVHCELCRTPHHAQCWEYWGRCSTYACTGKRSLDASRGHRDRGAAWL